MWSVPVFSKGSYTILLSCRWANHCLGRLLCKLGHSEEKDQNLLYILIKFERISCEAAFKMYCTFGQVHVKYLDLLHFYQFQHVS